MYSLPRNPFNLISAFISDNGCFFDANDLIKEFCITLILRNLFWGIFWINSLYLFKASSGILYSSFRGKFLLENGDIFAPLVLGFNNGIILSELTYLNSNRISSSVSSINHAKKKIVANGQKAANKFVGCNIVADGIWGNKTKKAAIKVVQTALNKDYGAKLSVDGIWGSATDKAFGSHYVKVGERQWLVTALEILCALKGKDPKGIEHPGVFGQGLKKACGTSKAVKKTFKDLCS